MADRSTELSRPTRRSLFIIHDYDPVYRIDTYKLVTRP